MTLINAFDKLALEGTQEDIELFLKTSQLDLFERILIELRIMNMHLEKMSGLAVRREDVDDERN